MSTTRKPHPQTGKGWEDVPAGEWLTAAELAPIIGITSKAVTNRFQQGRCPEGWTVRRTPGCNLYKRIQPPSP